MLCVGWSYFSSCCSFECSVWVVLLFFFFFSSRRRHTRYIGDWSSDVCSSDLKLARLCVLQKRSTKLGAWAAAAAVIAACKRSEERRVGKECRSRWWRYH